MLVISWRKRLCEYLLINPNRARWTRERAEKDEVKNKDGTTLQVVCGLCDGTVKRDVLRGRDGGGRRRQRQEMGLEGEIRLGEGES
jgi:hypothetical protein